MRPGSALNYAPISNGLAQLGSMLAMGMSNPYGADGVSGLSAADDLAKGREIDQRMEARSPENRSLTAGLVAHLTNPQAQEADYYVRNGGWMDKPGDNVGPIVPAGPRPEWATDQKLGDYMSNLAAQNMNLAGTGDTRADQLIGGIGELRRQDAVAAYQPSNEKEGKFAQIMRMSAPSTANQTANAQALRDQSGAVPLGNGQFVITPYSSDQQPRVYGKPGQYLKPTEPKPPHIDTVKHGGGVDVYRDGHYEKTLPPEQKPHPAPKATKYDEQIQRKLADWDMKAPQMESHLASVSSSLDDLAGKAEELASDEGLYGIFGLRGAFPNAPGSSAANAQAKLDTIKGKVGFATLQAMRDASKTGGALGNVTEKELHFLQNAVESLQNAQGPEQAKRELQDLAKWARSTKTQAEQALQGERQQIETLRHQQFPGDGAPPMTDGNTTVDLGNTQVNPELVKKIMALPEGSPDRIALEKWLRFQGQKLDQIQQQRQKPQLPPNLDPNRYEVVE